MFEWFEKRKKAKEEALMKKAMELAHQINEDKEKQKLAEKERIQKEKDEELRLARIALEERRRKAKESDEIYLEIVAEEITSEGVKFEMDWNQAFIDACKKNGITGDNDEIIVHKYLSLISRQVQLEEVANNYINNDGYEEGEISKLEKESVEEKTEE